MSEYVITDGTRYIFRNYEGKYVPVSNQDMADVFSKKQAENVCNSSLPKALRNIFYIEKHDIAPKNIKQVTQKDLIKNTEKLNTSESIQGWVEKIHNMNGLFYDAKKRKIDLKRQLKALNNEILDIEHYIEFQNLNAAQGYKASMDIKKCRIKRRTVKNEIAVIDVILKNKMGEVVSNEVRQKINSLDSRTYKPRIRKDLFDL